MAINIPTNFRNDIQGRDTALIPLIKIGDIYVSTNNMVYDGNSVLPLLLSNPSLKESIDIEKRNYKISNITLSLSNYPYNGNRFSDSVSGSIINEEVKIYWVSPSTTNFEGDTSAFMVYQGQVRRYEHDDKTVKLVIEDRSQAKLHKDLPIANLGTGDEVPDKYKNKPIPMVYGHVDRSPCIMTNSVDSSQYIIRADNDDTVSYKQYPYDIIGSSENLAYLYVFRDGQYSVALSDANPAGASIWANHQVTIGQHTSFNYKDTIQYDYLNNTIVLYKNMRTSVDGFNQVGVNPIGLNHIVCHFRSQVVQIKQYGFNDEESIDGDWIGADGGTSTQNVDIYYDPLYSYTPDEEWSAGAGDGWTDIKWVGSATPTEWHGWKMDFSFNSPPSSIDGQYYSYVVIFMKMYCQEATGFGTEHHLDVYTVTNNGDKQMQYPMDNSSDDPTVPPVFDDLFNNTGIDWHGAVNKISLTAGIKSSSNADASTKIRIDHRPEVLSACYSENIFVLDNFLEQEFYLDVNGREMDADDSPSALSAIEHILENELGQNINLEGAGSYDWQYAFTVNKPINSKKLIEGIASASPYIPRFDHMGNFKFSTIPKEPTSSDIVIKNEDVIDFSFSRTKIEDVYTKVVFKYNWDYAREEFNGSVESDILDIFPDYDPTFYGFKMPDDGDYDHADSTLIIDDDRGKYIRDDVTAQSFCNWFLLWSCNQHLKMKVKLPLKYMEIEIGDFVNFDVILGGVKPYNIDYTYGDTYNGQWYYPVFMVFSTSKTLDYVEIECIQMHTLNANAVIGCPDAAACNFVEGVTIGDTCNYPEPYRDCDGNCINDSDGDGVCDEEDDCVGNNELPPDCEGVCGGSAALDDCGVCGGDNSSCADCDGVPNGIHDIDDCQDCISVDSVDWNAGCSGCTHPLADNYNPDIFRTCSNLNNQIVRYSDVGCCEWSDFGLSTARVQIFRVDGHNPIVTSNIEGELNSNGNVGIDIPININDAKEGNTWGNEMSVKYTRPQDVGGGNLNYFSAHAYTNNDAITVLEGTLVLSMYANSGEEIELYPDTMPMIKFNRNLEYGEKIAITVALHSYDLQDFDHQEEFEIILNVEGAAIGDLNGDGGWNVLDIVVLANCILANNCPDLEYGYAGDCNGDGFHNVLDIVTLANCILAQNCEG